MNKTKINKIFEIFQKNNPNPTTELYFKSNFELLVAVILSAQATDKSVNIATKNLYKTANTPKKILLLGEQKLRYYIKSIGLYKTKASNIINMCKILIENYQSNIPESYDNLISLPGVGRKTANVILNTAFKQPTIAVDTHIFRLANRINIAPGKNVITVEKKLINKISSIYLRNAHHWLILQGRYICTARNPKCYKCKIYEYCEYDKKKYFLNKSRSLS